MIDKASSVFGLVLAGGQSRRMGRDKGLLDYHGMEQREYLFRELEKVCDNTFYSIRQDQVKEFDNPDTTIPDQNTYKGPFNGLLSAYEQHPEAAWLVMACDLPLIDATAFKALIQNRDPGRVATAFATKSSGLPEPLAAIWEPHGLEAAKEYLKNAESSCPRKFLIRYDAKLVIPGDDKILANANAPEDFREIQHKINS